MCMPFARWLLAWGWGAGAAAVTALGASSVFFPVTAKRIDIVDGRDVFERHCASCHSMSSHVAQGVGPALGNIGQIAGSRVAGQTAEAYIFRSIVAPEEFRTAGTRDEMPRQLASQMTDDELHNVTAFLSSLGGRVNPVTILKLRRPESVERVEQGLIASLETVETGRALFFGKGKCSECHALAGSESKRLFAPDLAAIGSRSRASLQEAIDFPEHSVAPMYREAIVEDDGVIVRGVQVVDKNGALSVVYRNHDGTVSRIAVSKKDSGGECSVIVRESTGSPMPSYGSSLTPEDRNAIVEFLCTLR